MTDLRNMKVDELKDIAREYAIIGAWKMTKDRLIEAILNAAALNKEDDKYFDSAAQNEPEAADEEVIEEESQDEPESAEKKPKGKMIEYNGKSQNLNQWAKELGMPGQTLFARLYISNWPVEKAFTTPTRRKNKEEA